MAVLQVPSKEALGEFVADAARDPQQRALLVKKESATELVRAAGVIVIPPGDFVVFHEDEQSITHLILPLANEVQAAVDDADAGNSPYLTDYVPQPLKDIDVAVETRKALFFRIGEYAMGRCKT